MAPIEKGEENSLLSMTLGQFAQKKMTLFFKNLTTTMTMG